MIVNPRESVGYAQTLLPIKHISFSKKEIRELLISFGL